MILAWSFTILAIFSKKERRESILISKVRSGTLLCPGEESAAADAPCYLSSGTVEIERGVENNK